MVIILVMKLTELKQGEKAVIKSFTSPDLALKLMEMGMMRLRVFLTWTLKSLKNKKAAGSLIQAPMFMMY